MGSCNESRRTPSRTGGNHAERDTRQQSLPGDFPCPQLYSFILKPPSSSGYDRLSIISLHFLTRLVFASYMKALVFRRRTLSP